MLKLHQVLKSSRAAIDLASIMVGIIIIGLIGGVIAATVFAVIPWAQNNAAKQQLDSVVSAESSYRGLSADKDTALQNSASSPTSTTDPNQVVLNATFTGSAGLAKNNLLALNANGLYCVIATTDGKDYHAYSKSGSGQWYYATSGKTQPSEYTGTTPCVTTGAAAGTVDTAIDNGSGAVPTTPSTGGGTVTPTPTPATPVVTQYGFDDGTTKGWSASDSTIKIVSSTANHSGGRSIAISRDSSTSTLNGITYNPLIGTSETLFKEGSTYTVQAYLYNGAAASGYISPQMTVGGVSSAKVTNAVTWTAVSVTFTATASTPQYISFASTAQSYSVNSDYFRVDDITITQNS